MSNTEQKNIISKAFYKQIKQELSALPSDEELRELFPVTEEKREKFIKRVYKKKMPIYIKYLRYAAVITLIVLSSCILSYLYNSEYILNNNILNKDGYAATQQTSSYIETVEISNNEISKIYKDRATVTLVTICIRDILKGDFIINEDTYPIYTITLTDNKNRKEVYGLSPTLLFYNDKAYPIEDDEYNKLLDYLK